MRGGAHSITIWAVPLGLLALAAALFALDLGGVATALSGAEYGFYQQERPRPYEDPFARSHFHVRVLNFDDAAIEKYGAWPWASDRLAQLTDALKAEGSSVVVYAFPLNSGDPASPQRFAAQLPQAPQYDAARDALNKMVSADEALGESLVGARAVTGYTLENISGDTTVPVKTALSTEGSDDPFHFVSTYRFAARALPLVETASFGVGAMNLAPDRDGVVRNLPLIYRLNDAVVPSIDAEALRAALTKPEIHSMEGSIPGVDATPHIASVSFGGFIVPTRRDGAFAPWFAKGRGSRALDVSAVMNTVKPPNLRDSIVVIAPPGATIRTPAGLESAGDVHAEALENVLLGQSLKESAGYLPQLVFLAVAGAALIILIARIGLLWGGAFAVSAIAAAQSFGWVLFTNSHILLDTATPTVALLLCWFGGFGARVASIAGTRNELKRSFAGMLPAPALDRISREPSLLKLDGETRTVTCLSCGLRGYAALAESFKDDPADFTRMINTALAPLVDAALDHGGTIGHLSGEGFMAYWNAPLDDPEHAIHACDAAQAMTVAIATVNEQLSQERRFDGMAFRSLEIGVGISTGPAIAGGFTSHGQTSYSVTGDCTLLAQRTRELSEQYGPAIVVTDDTRKAAERGYAFLEVDFIAAGPREDPVKLFAVLGNPLVRASPKFRALATFHDHIFESVRTQQWGKARELIDQCRKLSGASQKLYDLHLARIAWFEKNPPGSDWDGAFRSVVK
ncbi:MAG TPA: adenylate/guanylate cyclase domain-containing protein [Rhizomicrobium sp.]|nr:adenylate/guanylate cyclase domain-containing protein [Rhizomicrobium sp.]